MKTFKTIDNFEKFIRKNGTPDYVKVNGITFTMDNYDMSGKEISYSNKKKEKTLIVETENRYGETKFTDAKAYIDDMCGYRTDINYLQ